MQLALIAGRHYFLEEPDLCSSRNITGISTWISEATERIKIAIAPLSILAARKKYSSTSLLLYKSALALHSIKLGSLYCNSC